VASIENYCVRVRKIRVGDNVASKPQTSCFPHLEYPFEIAIWGFTYLAPSKPPWEK
jgi:hypothetical protein